MTDLRPDGSAPHDSAPEPDGIVRSEERLTVTTRRVPAVRAVLRTVIVVERQTITVNVAHEEVRLDQLPIDPADVEEYAEEGGAHRALPDIVLYKEELVVTKRLVPVERVRVEVSTVSEEQQITESVRHEQIDVQRAPAGA